MNAVIGCTFVGRHQDGKDITVNDKKCKRRKEVKLETSKYFRPSYNVCRDCTRKRGREYMRENRERMLAYQNKRNREARQQIIEYYGEECECCGEDEEVFLALDHIDEDGAEWRRKMGSSGKGVNFYHWLIRHEFPELGLQLLCHNCNWAKTRGGCPHVDKD